MQTNHTSMITTHSRRELIKLAGVSAAALAAASAPALARQPDGKPGAGKEAGRPVQGAGFYALQLGDVQVAVISDGWFSFNPPHPTLAANATREQVEKALNNAFVDPADVRVQVNGLLIKTPRDTVLVDTGTGGAFGATNGKLVENLGRFGVKPTDVTAVIITHLHGDHMLGLLNEEGRSNFPNAENIVHKLEHDFWAADTHDFSASRLPKDMIPGFIEGAKKVIAAANFTLVEGEREVRPGVTAIPSPGHTPGHIALQIDGGARASNSRRTMLYLSDTVHHPAIQFPHPEFAVMFDANPEQSIASRRKLFDRAAADRTLLCGAHIPFPSVGHIRRNTAWGYDWVPAMWEW